MKSLWKSILMLFSFVMVVLCSATVSNATNVTDTKPSPVAISDFNISTDEAKKGDVVTYNFTLTDVSIEKFLEEYGEEYDIYSSEYGVNKIILCWSSSKKQTIRHTYKWDEDKNYKDSQSLKVSGKISVKKGMQAGDWRLSSIYCEVGADGEGFCVQDNRINNADISMDLSMADFTVSGTGKADNKAPTVKLDSLKISKRYVKRNQKSTFSVKVADQSTIKKVTCSWNVYDIEDKGKKGSWDETYSMTYNKKKKRYQCFIKLDSQSFKKATLYCIRVQDIYGNETEYVSQFTDYTPKKKTRKYYNAYKKMTVIAK